MNLEKLETDLNKTIAKIWKVEKILLTTLKSLGVSIAEYGFLVWAMLFIWGLYGWERTALVLACGVILFGLRQRNDSAIKSYEIARLKKELEAVTLCPRY